MFIITSGDNYKSECRIRVIMLESLEEYANLSFGIWGIPYPLLYNRRARARDQRRAVHGYDEHISAYLDASTRGYRQREAEEDNTRNSGR